MGFVTKGMGRPLNTAVFTVHKLIALAFVIYLVINIIGLLKNTPKNAFMWAMVVVSGLLVITQFATGAILSFEKPAAKVIYIIHNISSALLILTIGLTYYIAVKK
jgi:heme A synthase